jgi:hypothetical protein
MLDTTLILTLISAIGAIAILGTAICCSAMWWQQLKRPGLYLALAVLAMSGLHGLLSRVSQLVRLIDVFLEAMQAQSARVSDGVTAMLGAELFLAIATAVATIVLGYFLLRASMRLQRK